MYVINIHVPLYLIRIDFYTGDGILFYTLLVKIWKIIFNTQTIT